MEGRLSSFFKNYVFNKVEFGKLLVVLSITSLAFSSHILLEIDEDRQRVEETSDSLEEVRNIVYSDNFNSSLNALGEIKSTDIGKRFVPVIDAIEKEQKNLKRLDETLKDLDETYRTYQWVFLASVLGLVAGLSVLVL